MKQVKKYRINQDIPDGSVFLFKEDSTETVTCKGFPVEYTYSRDVTWFYYEVFIDPIIVKKDSGVSKESLSL